MTLAANETYDRSLPSPDARAACATAVNVPIMRAGILAQEFCRTVSHAKVEAIFERCFYLRHRDKFVCFGEPDIGNGPLTLAGNLRLSNEKFRPGLSAAVCDRHILIGDSIRLTLDHTKSWRPPPWPACPLPRALSETCATLAQCAAIEAPHESLARCVSGRRETSRYQPPLARIAAPRIAIFERWLSGALDARAIPAIACREAIQGLIGLGPGLTPSGDDFLVGTLASLEAIGERKAHAALARAITGIAGALTAPLSACFLRAAAAAHFGEDLHLAVSSALTGDADTAIKTAGTIGHSSGWDMMAGIVTTLRIAAAARLGTRPAAQAVAFS